MKPVYCEICGKSNDETDVHWVKVASGSDKMGDISYLLCTRCELTCLCEALKRMSINITQRLGDILEETIKTQIEISETLEHDRP